MKIELEGTYTNICDQMIDFLRGSGCVITTIAELTVAAKGIQQPVEQIDSKPKRAVNKAKAPEPEPEIQIEEPPVEEPETEEEDVTPEAEKAVALHKLKEQQLSRLRDLFNAGKGSLVRDLLKKYGNGAKVFPEVEAAQFPDIKKELDRELGAH